MSRLIQFINQDVIFSKLLTKGRSGIFLFIILMFGGSVSTLNNVIVKVVMSFLILVLFAIFDLVFIGRFLFYCLSKKD